MNWRPLAALQSSHTVYLHAQPAEPETTYHHPYDYPDDRSPALAEALARLEAATRLRDGDAVARILNGLSASDDGQWLLRQCVSAGLREVASVIADTPGGRHSASRPSSYGAA